MFLKSFDSCEAIYDRGYRGNAGRKISVLYEGEPWMLKFPESTRETVAFDTPARFATSSIVVILLIPILSM